MRTRIALVLMGFAAQLNRLAERIAPDGSKAESGANNGRRWTEAGAASAWRKMRD